MGALPLVEGMPVIFTYNYDVAGGIVNGTEGTVKQVNYRIAADGKRYAKSCIIIVNDVSCPTLPNLQPREVVALMETVTFTIQNPVTKANITITCKQLPILSAFAMTDYKSQGKTLARAILDIESCPSIYSLYVMLCRVKSLDSVLILRPFDKKRLHPRSTDSTHFKTESKRLRYLCDRTMVGIPHNPLANVHLLDMITLEREIRK